MRIDCILNDKPMAMVLVTTAPAFGFGSILRDSSTVVRKTRCASDLTSLSVHMIKKLLKTILRGLGYEIHARRRADCSVGFNPSYLGLICQPKTVFDVGIGYGTHPLYEAFPEAKFVLVEPLKEYEGAIRAVAEKYDCDILCKAVGEKEGLQEISVDLKQPEKSSFVDRTSLTKTQGQLEKRAVEVTTLDAIFASYSDLKRPILLKIDTEGHELKVLFGSRSLLRVTEIVIAEVSIAKRFEDSYEFEDLIMFMKENGFYLFTFLSLTHRNGELRPRYADIVFKRRDACALNSLR